MVAVTIEGISGPDTSASRRESGAVAVDVGEYYGTDAAATASLVRHVQLKHSTVRQGVPWPPSALQKTIRGFAARYKALLPAIAVRGSDEHLEFCLVSNRPVSPTLLASIHDVGARRRPRRSQSTEFLQAATKLKGPVLAAFCRRLRFAGAEENYAGQRAALFGDTARYLPGHDSDAPVQLKELVTKKATSEFRTANHITRTDVLRALGVSDPSDLFPAPARLETATDSIPRVQEREIADRIRRYAGHVIVHAPGGVGKSILSQRLGSLLPPHSVCIVYDCFGHGDYRRPSRPRHRHADGLVQISNELASLGLCDPLVPASIADAADYLKAFAHRLAQAASVVRARNADALICVCIDAADNAEMAARESGYSRSFPRDLIRDPALPGVRIVFLCRTERVDHLDPPPDVLTIPLSTFSVVETAAHLRRTHPSASEHDATEFHRLTSQNPRVQAVSLDRSVSLADTLAGLGPNPTTVDAAIADLLDRAVADTRERHGRETSLQVDEICAALAILRPLVPIEVLARVAGTTSSVVASLAADLGRPLMVIEGAVQFRDEPVETWFRQRYRPSSEQLGAFIARLRPMAADSAYVASTLPQLMLEAGQLDELVTLALSSQGLPTNNPVERRDIELQRLHFALRASLRAGALPQAAKLAFRAAGESAGDQRQRTLFRENADLVATLLDPARVHELASRRSLRSGWFGSHHVYQASLLSFHQGFAGEARSSLRMAEEWLRAWSQHSRKDREKETVSDEDIAALALSHLNVHGSEAAAKALRLWRPRSVSFRAGRQLARTLVDHCRWDDLRALGRAAGDDVWLVLALALELDGLNHFLPAEAITKTLRILLRPKLILEEIEPYGSGPVLRAITALVRSSHTLGLAPAPALASLVTRYLPTTPSPTLSSRHGRDRPSAVAAYCLRAALLGQQLQLEDLADAELRQPSSAARSRDSSHERDFRELVGSVFPLHQIRTSVCLGAISRDEVSARLSEAVAVSSQAIRSGYHTYTPTIDEIAELWLDVLVRARLPGSVDQLIDWLARCSRPPFTPTLTRLARTCARTAEFERYAFVFAKQAHDLAQDAREDAESEASAHIGLARAIFTLDAAEAREYLARSVDVAAKLGDEVMDRWTAVLDLADRSAEAKHSHAQDAYQLARCAEITYRHVVRDKYFDWESTVASLVGLCPSSSLAILSRWRDRAFGSAGRLLPTAVAGLLARGALDGAAAAALVGFRFDWPHKRFLGECLAALTDADSKRRVADVYVRYLQLDRQSHETWTAVGAALRAHHLDPSTAEGWAAFESSVAPLPKGASDLQTPKHMEGVETWDSVFEGLAVHTADGIVNAYARFTSQAPPLYHEQFFRQLCLRVAPGREIECLRAIEAMVDFEPYHYARFLESVPDSWRGRLSVQGQLRILVTSLCARFCLKITRSRDYQPLPLVLAAEVGGLEESVLIDETLRALAGHEPLFDSGRLFTIVGLVAARLSQGEALEALRYVLGQFESVTDPDDGDGPWRATLAPPLPPAASLAGYVFAALAAPAAGLRWEAAHVVRALCALGCRPVVDPLVGHLGTDRLEPFSASGLHFYADHANLWLLMGLHRSAIESPEFVAAYAERLVEATRTEHVAIRDVAAAAVLALLEAGAIAVAPETREWLRGINSPALPVVQSRRWDRGSDAASLDGDGEPEACFSFDYDLSKYHLDVLANCFGLRRFQLERVAGKIAKDEWHLDFSGRWDDDARVKRGLLRERRTGSLRTTETLAYYLSFHLMMTVAGRLLATLPSHQGPDESEPEFVDWLRRFKVSRSDGRWLSDRRDAPPFESPTWKAEPRDDHWRWQVSSADLDRAFGLDRDDLDVWSHWTSIDGRRVETVHVSTALVASDRSESLLRALQTASDPQHYRIPSAGDESEIDHGPYQLRGWILEPQESTGLDEEDPWAAGIKYPPARPTDAICELLGIRADDDARLWVSTGVDGIPAITRRTWACEATDHDPDSEGNRGERLLAKRATLTALLARTGMALVAEVNVRRRIRRYSYETGSEDYTIPPYSKVYIVTSDGVIRTLVGGSGTREQDRR